MDLFEIEGTKQLFREKIKVVGVGGGGCNALNHIIASNVQGVEFIAANTDIAHLDQSLAEKKLILGRGVDARSWRGRQPRNRDESSERVHRRYQGMSERS